MSYADVNGLSMYYEVHGDAAVTEDNPALVLAHPFDYSGEIRAIQVPTQLIFADADMYSMQHICDFWALLGGGRRDAGWDGAGRPAPHQLAILPDTTHYTIFASQALAQTAERFLDA